MIGRFIILSIHYFEVMYTQLSLISHSSSKKLLKTVRFTPKQSDIDSLKEKISCGYGDIICLNKEHDLYIQYHGIFQSFLIGIGINPINSNQPDVKLLRIETKLEKTHELKKFKGKKPTKAHIHWFEGTEPIYITVVESYEPLQMLDRILNREFF